MTDRNHFGEFRPLTFDPRPTPPRIKAELSAHWQHQGPCPADVEARKRLALVAEQVAEIEQGYKVTKEMLPGQVGALVFTGPTGDIVRVRGTYGAGIWPLFQPLLIVQADEYAGMRLSKRAFEDAARRHVERIKANLLQAAQLQEGGAA